MFKALLIGGMLVVGAPQESEPVAVAVRQQPVRTNYVLAAQQQPAQIVVQVEPKLAFGTQVANRTVSDVWIGVRMAPVPAPLAAHLGREGMMVTNIVEGSPADEAGVERYDVVVSFDGQPIDTGEELVDAIAEVGAGRSTELVIIRGAQEQAVQIRPAERPVDGGLTYRFDEPTWTDANTQYFGHNITVTPDGQWQMQPLGQMHDLSKLLDEYDFDTFDFDDLDGFSFNFGGQGPRIRMRSLPGFDFNVNMNNQPFGLDNDSQVEIVIRSSDGENTVEIQRHADGSFTVTHSDGNDERVSDYEDAEQFEAEDPDAYETFESHGAGQSMIFMQPQGGRLPQMQKDFSATIERRLREAHERATEAMQKAGEARQHAWRHIRSSSSSSSDGQSVNLNVNVNDDGVRVELTEDGNTKVYEFTDLDHFERTEPELYERCRPLVGGR